MTLPEASKLLTAVILYNLGAAGFCISFFGLVPSLFILLMILSLAFFWFIVISYVRRKGLLSFMSPGMQKLMTETRFFDILVNVFIYRRISKMIIAIFSPFLKASSPEEAKKVLKEEGKIPKSVYRGLFRKGIMNNFSPKLKALMLPRKEPVLAKKLRRGETMDIITSRNAVSDTEQDISYDLKRMKFES